MLNAKGHLDAHLFLFATPNDIWIDADEELREQLRFRLERYVIADDVVIEDVTDQFALFHVLAESDPKTAGAKFCPRSRRLGSEGWDLWVESAGAEKARNILAADYRAMDESEWEVLRIENGIPRWGRELTPEIIPPEANLQARAIDYEKGCYIGQEVISRMKMSGQSRQRLCGLTSETALVRGNGGARRNKGGWPRNERGLFPADELLHRSGDDKARLYRTRHVVSHVGGRRGNSRRSRCAAVQQPILSLTPAFRSVRAHRVATKAVSTAFSFCQCDR